MREIIRDIIKAIIGERYDLPKYFIAFLETNSWRTYIEVYKLAPMNPVILKFNAFGFLIHHINRPAESIIVPIYRSTFITVNVSITVKKQPNAII